MAVQATDRQTAAVLAAPADNDDPATLHRIMQMMIGEGLKTCYLPPQKLPHELSAALLQLKQEERRQWLAPTAAP